jgi:hypothetical protein
MLVAYSGWTIWNVACDTTITVSCGKFWAGYSDDPLPGHEVLGVDNGASHPENKWKFANGTWEVEDALDGDFMIRAFLDSDPATAPDFNAETSLIIGAAPPGGIDTATTYIENLGTGCDLEYQVSVIQSARLSSAAPGTGGLSNRRRTNRLMRVPAAPDISEHPEAIVRTIAPDGLGSESKELEPPPFILDSGGPDQFGYTWIDSDEPGGPLYFWIDISSIGTEVTWDYGNPNDGFTDPIPMGMTFNYYGSNYENIVISTNGLLFFNPAIDFFEENVILPSADLGAAMAVDWDNLDGGADGHCYYYYNTSANSFIVSWVDWSHNPAPTNQHDFQIILDGDDGSILFLYGPGSYQDDITIGIQNESADDGLMVAFNEPYIHSQLAIKFSPPIFWLATDLANGSLPPLSGPLTFNIFMDGSSLPTGIYNGAIVIESNDPDEPVSYIDVQFRIEGICAYVPGDVNSSGDANGIDVTYMVTYFKGGSHPQEECVPCSSLGLNMLYPQGDVSGSCQWNGVDVTYFVSYLKGIGPPLSFCPDCPPAGRTTRMSGGPRIKESQPILLKPLPAPMTGESAR